MASGDESEQGAIEVKQEDVSKVEEIETQGFAIVRSKKMNQNNPSTWSNPPPPGIDMDEEESKHSAVSSSKSVSGSIIDVIDPFIKNPEYIKYKKSLSRERGHYKRSRSRSRDRKKRYRSRRHSRSRSRGRRHRRYSHSSSRSRSSSYERRHRHKKRRTRKYSRSNSRTRNKYRSERTRSRRSRSRSDDPYVENDPNEEKCEEDEQEVCKENAFKNDGSFLEMFKKLQEEKEKAEAEKAAAAAGTSEAKRPVPAFGKRRGGRVLKTGMVEKTKACEEDELSNAQDPWSIYLKEVKKYKEACCDDDSKTRPLVK